MSVSELTFDDLPDADRKRKNVRELSFDDIPNKRTAGEQAARQGGLTARYLLEGPAQLVASVIGDPVNTAINYGIRGVNKLGANVPELGMPSQAITRGLNSVFPSPETPTEHVVGAVSKGMTGGMPITAAAMRAPAAVAQLPFVRAIAGAPVVDVASQGVGGGASETVKQAGGSPAWQMAAGVAAPMALGATASAARAVASAPKELVRPVTRAGAEQVAADTIGRIAQDRRRSLENLSRFNQLVARGEPVNSPGFAPTAAAVSGDYGLVGGQQMFARGQHNPLFANRAAANNEALATDLGRLSATTQQIEQFVARREQRTAALRERAFSNASGDVNYIPVAERIGEIASTPAGGRVEPQKALTWLAQRLDTYASQGRSDARNAYALYQDIGELIAGKVKDNNGASIRLSGGLANDVKRVLGDEIEAVAPGFRRYLETYSRYSRPIERLEAIRDRLGDRDLTRVTNALPQVTDNGATFTISQDKVRGAVNDLRRDTNLAPRQSDVLERVLAGLNAETFAARGGKMPGSDTYQNIASANFVNRVLGEQVAASGLGKAVQAPFNLALRPFESRIQDIIAEAYLDPALMERLLRKARTSRGGLTASSLLDFAAPRSFGGLLGAVSQ